MSKIHPVYLLIHSLESSEKAYFKRFGFKKESKNNDSIKRLFDLIDKQDKFNLEKLLKDKKVNDNVKTHIHVNLNYLQKRIVHAILESKRDTDIVSNILTLIAEFNFYKEKNLFSLATKSLKSINRLMLNNDFFLLKPYIKSLFVELNRLVVGRDYKMTNLLITDFEDEVNSFYTLANTQLIGFKIEGLMDRNGGTVLKSEKEKQLAHELILKTKALIAEDRKDFQLRSILANNLYILTLMVGKWQDFEQISSSLIDFYHENIQGNSVSEEMFDFMVVLINLSYFSLMLGDNSHIKSLEILERDQSIVAEGSMKDKLILQTHCLRLVQISIYEAEQLEETTILNYADIFKNVPRQSKEGLAYMRQLGLILFKKKSYKEVLDVTADIMQQDVKGIHSNSMCSTRLIRAFAWLKLENLTMFESELNQIYRFALELDKDSFLRKIVNYVKRLNSFPSKEKKSQEVKEIQKEYDALLVANEVSKYISYTMYMEPILFDLVA